MNVVDVNMGGYHRSIMSFNARDCSKLNLKMSGVNMPIEQANYKQFQAQATANATKESFWQMLTDQQAQDIMPKPEDYIAVPFRLLSETTVAAGSWRSTDFSKPGVLKKSAAKLEGKPVYSDHYTAVDNWAGIVKNITYQAKRTVDGQTIPGGLNGMMMIDAKTNPTIARGVLSGGIFSNSVTVVFDWEPSHEYEDPNEFMRHIGKMGADGKMVRRIATQIFDYYETSLVWLGADPYAKLIDEDGNLKFIDDTSVYNASFSKEVEKVQNAYTSRKSYSVSCGLTKDVLNLAHHSVTLEDFGINKSTDDMNEEALKLLLAMIGVTDVKEVTPAHMEALQAGQSNFKKILTQFEPFEFAKEAKPDELVTKLVAKKDAAIAEFKLKAETAATELEAKTTEVAELTTKVTDLTTTNTSLKETAELGKTYIDSRRAEAIRLYKVAAGDDVDEAVVSLFTEAKPNAIDGLLKQYGKTAAEKFTATCLDCESTNVSMQSSITNDDKKEDVADVTGFDLATIRSRSGLSHYQK